MSSKIRAAGLVLVAIVAISAAAASAAQASAPRWKVKGAFLEAGKTKTATWTSLGIVQFSSAFLSVKAPKEKCHTHGTIKGSSATSPGTTTYRLKCVEVKLVGSEAKCIVKTPGSVAGEITSEPLEGTLVWLNENQSDQTAGVKVAPESGTTFVKAEISGVECPVASAKPYVVNGQVISKALPVATEVEAGELNFPEAPVLTWWNNATPRVKQSIEANRLKVGTESGLLSNITYSGTYRLELSPKENFGIFAG